MSLLTGESVSLRPYQGDEDAGLVARWLASPMAVHSSRGPRFLALPAARELVAGSARQMLVAERAGQPIGALFWQSSGPAGGSSLDHVVGVPEVWGAGAGAEAVSIVLAYQFQGLNAHRVQSIAAVYDRMMVEIAVRLGLTVEGVLRDYFYVDGRYHHAVVLAQLADAYRDRTQCGPAPAVTDEDKAVARRILNEHLAGSGHSLDPSEAFS